MSDQPNRNRRKALGAVLGSSGVVSTKYWMPPVVSVVLLPAHAQASETEACVTDEVVGGPLLGNEWGAETCQEACEAAASDKNAELCSVSETNEPSGTECHCELDLPD